MTESSTACQLLLERRDSPLGYYFRTVYESGASHPAVLFTPPVGEYAASSNGTPEGSGITPGTRITIEYATMRDDRLAMFNLAERVMRLNIAADWNELSEAFRMEIRRAFGITGHICPVIPLQRRRRA